VGKGFLGGEKKKENFFFIKKKQKIFLPIFAVRLALDGFHASLENVPLPKIGRVSTAVVQRFCKPKAGGSNPSPGIALFRDGNDRGGREQGRF
jgi:hypothetical protein